MLWFFFGRYNYRPMPTNDSGYNYCIAIIVLLGKTRALQIAFRKLQRICNYMTNCCRSFFKELASINSIVVR